MPNGARYVRQLFTGGLNQDIDPAAVDLLQQSGGDANSSGVPVITYVSTCINMVFERGLILTRPPTAVSATTGSLFDSGTVVVGAKTLPLGVMGISLPTGTVMILGIASLTPKVYVGTLSPLGTSMGISIPTGPSLGGIFGIGTQIPASFSVAIVNQAVLIAGFTGGLYRWVPPATTYTVVPVQTPFPAGWLFVTKLYSRAIGAYAIGNPGSTVLNPITVGASAAGNETDWTSTNAYKTVLSDVPDEITGLGVIKGTVVVPRRYGFHLGNPTGVSPAIFNWSEYTDDAIGCLPNTFQIYGNVAFFMSDVGIHAFDLVSITDIGEGVYTEIFNIISNTTFDIQTFISYAYRPDFQPCYNIVLVPATPLQSPPQHWMYNIKERKWSRHSYEEAPSNFPALLGFPMRLFTTATVNTKNPSSGIGFLDQVTNSGRGTMLTCKGPGFNEGTMVEGASFETPQITLQPSYEDTALTRIMMSVYAGATSPAPTVLVSFLLNNVGHDVQFQTTDATLTTGWNFLWYNGRAVGQNFQVTVQFLGGSGFMGVMKVKEMWYEFTVGGVQRN